MTNALIQEKQKYDDKVSKIIDRVLTEIFGDEATLLIYEYMENRYSLRRDENVEKIDLFAEGLEEFLGSGAHSIEMKILEDVYSSYGLTLRPEFERRIEDDFVRQIKVLRVPRFMPMHAHWNQRRFC